MTDTDEFDGVTPDIKRAAEKRKAAARANTEAERDSEPVDAKPSRSKTTRG